MLNDQQRQSDQDIQPANVVVTTEAPPRVTERVVERVEPGPQTTRVEVNPRGPDAANELEVDRSTRQFYTRQQVVRERRFGVGKSIDLVWYALGVLEVVLAGRFFFELTAANSAAGFVQFILGISRPFVWPFNGIFPIPRDGNNAFDTNILIAMVVYAIVTWGITRLLAMTIEPPSVT